MKLLTARELVYAAKGKAARAQSAQTHQSYPIPTPAEKGLDVTFLYCVARPVYGQGLSMLAPSYRALLSAVDGDLREIEAVEPADLGVNDPPQKILGFAKMAKEITTTEQFLALVEQLYRSYDVLMPMFAEGQKPPAEEASLFQKCFKQLAEEPLGPYHRAVGKNFFTWLGVALADDVALFRPGSIVGYFMALSTVKLLEQARLHPAGSLPVGTHQSYPVPVPGPKGLRMAFLYCKAENVKPQEGYQIWPPSYIAYLHADTGRFEELRPATPKDFGQSHAADQPLGAYLSPPERLGAAFLTKQVSWLQAYDLLLPAFAARTTSPTPAVKQAVAEFKTLLPQVTEAPLLPYYQAMGKDFFAWLNAIKSA